MADKGSKKCTPLREAEDPRSPPNKLVKNLFEKLVELRNLVITGSTRIATLVLNPVIAASSLPELRSLHLASTFNTLRDPFHPSTYQTLQYYSALRSFELNILRSSEKIQSYSKPQIDPFPFRTKIIDVSLSGPLSSSPISVTTLLTSFGALPCISLEDTSVESNLYDFLDKIWSPEDLDYLEVKRLTADGAPSKGSFVDKLERFSNLSTLVVGGSCSKLDSSFYSALRSSTSLETFIFSKEALVSLKEVTKLITGPEKMKSLESIIFNNVEGEVGTIIEDVGEPYWNDELDSWAPYPDWILPKWSKEFTELGLIQFLGLAEEEGIEVSGSAITAIGVLEEFEEEAMGIEYWDEGDCCCGDEEEYENE
jgi:hypothetical protein